SSGMHREKPWMRDRAVSRPREKPRMRDRAVSRSREKPRMTREKPRSRIEKSWSRIQTPRSRIETPASRSLRVLQGPAGVRLAGAPDEVGIFEPSRTITQAEDPAVL